MHERASLAAVAPLIVAAADAAYRVVVYVFRDRPLRTFQALSAGAPQEMLLRQLLRCCPLCFYHAHHRYRRRRRRPRAMFLGVLVVVATFPCSRDTQTPRLVSETLLVSGTMTKTLVM